MYIFYVCTSVILLLSWLITRLNFFLQSNCFAHNCWEEFNSSIFSCNDRINSERKSADCCYICLMLTLNTAFHPLNTFAVCFLITVVWSRCVFSQPQQQRSFPWKAADYIFPLTVFESISVIWHVISYAGLCWIYFVIMLSSLLI